MPRARRLVRSTPPASVALTYQPTKMKCAPRMESLFKILPLSSWNLACKEDKSSRRDLEVVSVSLKLIQRKEFRRETLNQPLKSRPR